MSNLKKIVFGLLFAGIFLPIAPLMGTPDPTVAARVSFGVRAGGGPYGHYDYGRPHSYYPRNPPSYYRYYSPRYQYYRDPYYRYYDRYDYYNSYPRSANSVYFYYR